MYKRLSDSQTYFQFYQKFSHIGYCFSITSYQRFHQLPFAYDVLLLLYIVLTVDTRSWVRLGLYVALVTMLRQGGSLRSSHLLSEMTNFKLRIHLTL